MFVTDSSHKVFRDLLISSVKSSVKSNECGLLLSRGVDSISVGLASHYSGKSIHAYSFCLDTYESYDFTKAREVSQYMNWKFTPIIVPTQNLEEDFMRLVKLGCKKKTHFETVFPFLYVYPKIKETYVLTGWGADGYYGVSRKAIQHFKEPKEIFDKFRNDYFLPENTAGVEYHKRVSTKHNKVMVNPYLDKDVKSFFFNMDWYELNKPKQKHHIRDAFEEFKSIGNIKPHKNLQIESKVDELFETLLDNKNINFKNRSRIMDVCKDWSLSGSGSLDEFM